MSILSHITTAGFVFLLLINSGLLAQKNGTTSEGFTPTIPKMWDDAAMATLEIPLANPIGSPKHVAADYYYKIRVRPIYKSYPVYAPGHEPPGYVEWLKRQDPIIIWDDGGHRPALQTEADWIKAGEGVFDSDTVVVAESGAIFTLPVVKDSAWYEKTGMPVARNGVVPFLHYVIRERGKLEVGSFSCGMCHTRLMPDGTTVRGAQGSIPQDRAMAFTNAVYLRSNPQFAQAVQQQLFDTPWLNPNPQAPLLSMSVDEIAAVHEPIPPGVIARHRTSPFYPVQVPDLIGVKDRRYLDRTGLQQHRGIVDLMRYAALNQGGDDLANYAGFVPIDFPSFKKLPDPDKLKPAASRTDRYSDEQLYALALYLYSLQPPPNPNKFDALAVRGQEIFSRAGCSGCHTPPLYTNNKLTLAEGFIPPPDATEKYDILPISVGTDPDLALKTRRGTGYYKVPSLKGVWYRSMFGHSGWCATLEDWLDPRRTRDDYVPTGFKPYGARTYAVKGHLFGLDLSAEDRKALIAFLKTL